MSNDLCSPSDLAHLPGSPFTEAEVDAAVVTVRNAAGWHIAPVRPEDESDGLETVILDVECGEQWLRLPTMKLVSVDEIRDLYTESVIDDGLYRVSRDSNRVFRRGGYWPVGVERLEVDFSHGHSVVPADLLPVIAAAVAANRRVHSLQKTQEPLSNPDLFFGLDQSGNALSLPRVLERYSLLSVPGMA